MEKISVIVPIYNVEEYLDKCIQSLINQTYSNLEIILVNDGSTDNSLRICKKYESYPNILICNKKNGGLSDARNFGLDKATGNYICFVDSDDYIEKDMIEYLYNNLNNYKADISCCNIYMLYDNKISPKHPIYDNIICLSPSEAIKDTLHNSNIDYASWNKLYKKSLFDEIRFPKGKIYEDMFIMHELLHKSKLIVYGSECKYYYRQRENSITKSIFTSKKFDLLDAYDVIIKFINSNYPKLIFEAEEVIVLQKLNLLRDIFLSNKSIKYRKEIVQIKKSIKYSQIINISENKFNYLIIKYCPIKVLQIYYNKQKR